MYTLKELHLAYNLNLTDTYNKKPRNAGHEIHAKLKDPWLSSS